MKKNSITGMVEVAPQETKQGKREGQERKAPEVRLPQQGILSRSINQIKDGVADDYHDSPPPPAQSSVSSKSYSAPLIQKLIHGDCLDKLKLLADNSVDLLCTDPPYGLKFMGKDWDKALPSIAIWRECLRVLKPGAFAFIMCHARQDLKCRMILALEEAGFRVNFNGMAWIHTNGMSRRYDVAKAIDKQKGVEPIVVGIKKDCIDFRNRKPGDSSCYSSAWQDKNYTDLEVTVPASPEAKFFHGAFGGFSPKPAREEILVVMKPKENNDKMNYADQALSNQKGVTWMDDCSIPYAEKESIPTRNFKKQKTFSSGATPASKGDIWVGDANGRDPADILVSDQALDKHTKFFDLDRWHEVNCESLPEDIQQTFPFFVVPKPTGKAKNKGLQKSQNIHPTVKPLKLMKYLITMGSRPGDIIADPFCGSGTTCVAAKMLGRGYIGIEREEEYFKIAVQRVQNSLDQ